MNGLSNEALFIDYRNHGSQIAFAELVRRVGPRLFHFCLRIVRNSETARDIVQDTLLAAHRYRMSFDGRSLVSTWLTVIARNMCVARYRRDLLALVDGRDLRDRYDNGPFQAIEDADDVHRFYQALETLRADERRLIQIVDLADGRYIDAAKILGVPIGTIRSRRHRVLHKLRRKLAA